MKIRKRIKKNSQTLKVCTMALLKCHFCKGKNLWNSFVKLTKKLFNGGFFFYLFMTSTYIWNAFFNVSITFRSFLFVVFPLRLLSTSFLIYTEAYNSNFQSINRQPATNANYWKPLPFFSLKAWNEQHGMTQWCLNPLLTTWAGILETESALAVTPHEKTHILLLV